MSQKALPDTIKRKCKFPGIPSRVKGALALIVSTLLVAVFILYLCPLIDRISFVEPLVEFIDERDIDAGALYYTEIEEFSDAEITMKNIMSFTPGE